MKVSARNVFEGRVSRITTGQVTDEVELRLAGDDVLVAVVGHGGLQQLGLSEGQSALALIKAPWVMVSAPEHAGRLSARNQLLGVVCSLVAGGVTCDVGIRLPGGEVVHAVITQDAVRDLRLAVGQVACAVIKASDIVLATRHTV